MTVQELIKILQEQPPTDTVMVETIRGAIIVDDDWSRCQFKEDGETRHGFVLLAYGGPALSEEED